LRFSSSRPARHIYEQICAVSRGESRILQKQCCQPPRGSGGVDFAGYYGNLKSNAARNLLFPVFDVKIANFIPFYFLNGYKAFARFSQKAHLVLSVQAAKVFK
jgi:hypothetical protein